MHGRGRRGKSRSDSFVEVRIIVGLSFLMLVLAVPVLLWADWQGDNLPDSWEAQYGLSTNVYDPADLVGWWQMEPNATNTNIVVDRWTNQINGNMTNFGSSPYVSGLFSNALSFTTNSQVSFPTNIAALNTATNQFTFSGWFQSTNGTGTNTTIAAWADGQTNSWSVGVQTNGAAIFGFSDAAGNQQTITPTTNTVQLYDGTWHQVAVTYATNQVATLYVDGESEGSGTITNWASGPVASFTMGVTNSSSTNQPFILDETRLYNRALSSQEIPQLPITYNDLNGSGLSIYDDYLEGLSPLATNTTVTSGFINSGLTAYYGTNSPNLNKTSGDGQTVSASTFETNPLVVQVTDGSGNPLVGAPITFSIASGSDGGLSQTSGGTTSASVSLTTDSGGNATIYYQAGPDVIQNNTITATAVTESGNVAVTFTAHCGIQGGLQAWLEGDTGVTTDGSGNVSQWQDQSAASNSASQSTTGIQPQTVSAALNGHSVIRFDGASTYLGLPLCISDNFTMVTVFRSNQGAGTNDQWYNAAGIVDASVGSGANDFGLALDANGDVMTGVGNPDTSILSTHGGYNDSRGHIATFTRTESNGAFVQFVDSVYQGWQSGNTSSLTDPPGITIGATQTLAQYFGGDVAEVLLFNRKLTHDERHQIEGYLADKYGLYSAYATWPSAYASDVQAQISANQWTKSQADAYVAFAGSSPAVAPSGLLLWLKASAGLSTDSSGNVLQWVDQSPSGHVLGNQSDAGAAPPVLGTDAGGNATLTFNGGQGLYAPDYIPANGDLTMIVVGSCANNWSYSVGTTIGGNPQSGETRSYTYSYGTDQFSLYNDDLAGGTSSPPGEAAIHTITFANDSGAVNFYLSGVYNGYASTVGSDIANITSGFEVGTSAQGQNNYFGNISEILVYNRVLTDTERGQVEGSLADNYGLFSPNATWPMTYSADIQALIMENQWSKAQADAYVASFSGTVMAPAVLPAPGAYTSTQTVTVSSDTSDATIYYTTDGTTPTTSSTSIANGGELTISSTTRLKLMAADGIETNSSVTTAIYQIGTAGQLVVGDSFSMVLKPDGSIWTWGDDSRGQQGDNQANNPAMVPQEVPGLSGMTTVAAAGDHALVVDGSGDVWAWGADDSSQGGDGGTTDLYVPTEISGLSNIVSVFAGQANGFAVDSSGNLYGWGDNSNGQLGDGTNNSQSTPEAITSVTGVTKIASSRDFTVALTSDGTVWATGLDNLGQLGDSTQNNETFFQPVPGLSNVIDIAVGNDHALALLADGTVWSWGWNGNGELGHGNYNSSTFPQQIVGLPFAVAVRAVNSQSFVVLGDGTIRCFGYNAQGQLGLGTNAELQNGQDELSPTQPSSVRNVTQLAAGGSHTIVCTSLGAFYGWGDNSSYRVGEDYAQVNFSTQNEVHDPNWQSITKVASAEGTTLGLKSDGTVWAVGEGNNGVLGQGQWLGSDRPLQVSGLSSITILAAGVQSGYAIDSSGNLWAWGGNWDGQLGIGNYSSQTSVSQVTSLSNVTSVAGGDNHMLAIQSDGTVWASGDDSQGELGDGTTNSESSPIQVSGLTNPVQAAAGNNTSFILQSDGTVWAWGQNDSGQLGLGLIGNVSSPTQITGLPTMVAISVHETNGVGIDTSGNVWSWGPILGNSDGTPLEQTGVSNVTAVAAGSYHSLALASDGTLWGNGSDWNGQLGGSVYGTTSTFLQFPGVAGVSAIAANYASSLMVKQDGSISGFGYFDNGQLAGNLGVYIPSPQRVFGIGMTETAPTVAISSPSAGASETMATPIELQASASASAGSITQVAYYLNGVKIGYSTSGGSWDFSWTPVTYGEMTFEAVAVDSAGVAQVSAPVTVNVAYSNPSTGAPSQVTASSGASGTVYLGWTDNDSGATDILIQEQNSDGTWTTIATLSDITLTSYEVTGLTSGQDYNFRIVADNGSGTGPETEVSYSPSSSGSPVLTKVSGDGQAVSASSFAANPLVVEAQDSEGHTLAGVPISFGLGTGSDGGLALSSGGTTASTQSVTTNAGGQATIYYEAGADVLQNNAITASTASGSSNVSVNFTAYCGIQSGLAAWFRGDLGVTTSSGSVTQWVDQSSNQYSVSQTAGSNAPTVGADSTTGIPLLAFNGSQYLANSSDQASVTGDVTIITVSSTTTPTATANALLVGSAGSNQARGVGTDSNDQGYYNGSDISDGGALPTSSGLNISTVTYSQSASLASFYSQGVTNGTASSTCATVAPGMTIGSLLSYSPYLGWNGNIAEIIVYNRVLTTSERQQIELYLANKYEIYAPSAAWISSYSSDVQALINSNQWSKAQADAYVAFLASSDLPFANGLVAWFSSDSGTTVNGSGDLTQWVDQSPNHYTLTPNPGYYAPQPQLVSNGPGGQQSVLLQDGWMSSSVQVQANDVTIITIASAVPPNQSDVLASLGQTWDGATMRGIGYHSGNLSFISGYPSGLATFHDGSAIPQTGQLVFNTMTYSASSGVANFYDQGESYGSTTYSTSPLSAGITIGDSTPSGGVYSGWTGNVIAVMMFNRVLSDSERTEMENSLANRYGIYYPGASWISSFSSQMQSLIAEYQLTEAQANAYAANWHSETQIPSIGLALWVKADTGVTANGSEQVSQWQDQSPNQLSVVQSTGSAQPTLVSSALNGNPAISFDGSSQSLGFSPGLGNLYSGFTTFAVFAPNSPSNGSNIFHFASSEYSDFRFQANTTYNTAEAAVVNGSTLQENAQGYNDMVSAPQEYTVLQNGSSLQLYKSGVSINTVSGLAQGDALGGGDIGKGSVSGSFFNGKVGEIIVYNRPLSNAERQKVELYLANKYDLYYPGATWISSYTSAIQAEIVRNQWDKSQADNYVAALGTLSTNNPGMVTEGLALWLKADAGVTSSSGTVTQWVDQASGNILTPTSSSLQPQYVASDVNGEPGIRFNGTNPLTAGQSNNLGITMTSDATIITVGMSTTPSDGQFSVWVGDLNNGEKALGYDNSQEMYNLVLGGPGAMGGPAPLPGAFVSEATELDSVGGVSYFYQNGVNTASASAPLYGQGPGVAVGGSPSGSYFGWQGDLNEVLVYDRRLNPAELAQVDAYLANKYAYYSPNATWMQSYSSAVQAEIARNQWNKAQADNYVALQSNNPSMLTNGLKAWYKADSGVTQDGSGNVTQWVDQSGNYTATQSNSGNEPTYVASDLNGEPALRFNGSQWLSNGGTMGTGADADMTIITVAMSANPSALQSSLCIGGGGSNQNRGLGYNSSQEEFEYGGASALGAAAPPPSNWVMEAATTNASLNAVTFYQNGTQSSITALSGLAAVTPGVMVGGASDRSSPWQGDIAEVLVYDHALSASEMQEVTQYISDKYGIYDQYATWPSSYTLPMQTEIAKHQWTRDQVNAYLALQSANPTMLTNGLTMWFRADAGVTTSSGQVTAIADQTGNYNLSQSNSANQPTLVASAINGEPAIQFNGSQWLASPAAHATGLNGDMTVITVGMSTDTTDQTYSLYLGTSGSYMGSRATGYVGSELFDASGVSCLGGTAPPTSTFIAEATTLDGTLTNVAFYQNGASTGTNTVSGLQNLTTGITMGAAAGGTDGWQGEIAEQLVYDHQLSPSELQQVETYLAAKYGLTYSPVAPTISPEGGDYVGAQEVTITSSLTGVIHYTLDGTTPTASSPTYSGPLTLTTSAFVQAAVFSSTDGSLQSQIASAQFYIDDPTESGLAPTLTGLTTTSVSSDEIDLGWTAGTSSTYSQIYVYRSTNGGSYELIAILDPSDTSFQDTTVTAGNSYSYELGTYNQAGVAIGSAGSTVSPSNTPALTIQITTPSGAVPLP